MNSELKQVIEQVEENKEKIAKINITPKTTEKKGVEDFKEKVEDQREDILKN